MKLTKSIETVGLNPYPVDQAGKLDKVYAITRGSKELEYFPRSSEAYNAVLGLQLVTGVDKPMTSLIDVVTDLSVPTLYHYI